MVRWFIVDDSFTFRECTVKIDVCTCEDKEEGYRICEPCFMEHFYWLLWMREADSRLFC